MQSKVVLANMPLLIKGHFLLQALAASWQPLRGSPHSAELSGAGTRAAWRAARRARMPGRAAAPLGPRGDRRRRMNYSLAKLAGTLAFFADLWRARSRLYQREILQEFFM